MSIFEDLTYFTIDEFDHPYSMSENFLITLDKIRDRANVPIYISSDYRPGDDKAHGQGVAVDIPDDLNSDGISAHWTYRVVLAAMQMGITRIGIYDKHVHLDTWYNGPSEVLWQGTSR